MKTKLSNILKAIRIFLLVFIIALVNSCESGNIKNGNPASVIPIDAIFKIEKKSDFHISPDGKFISYVGYDGKELELYVENVETSETQKIPGLSISTFSEIYWVNNFQLAVSSDNERDRKFKIYIVDVDENKIKCVTDSDNSSSRIISINPVKENEIFIHSNKREANVTEVYSVNTLTFKMELVYESSENSPRFSQFYIDGAGELKLARSRDAVYMMNSANGEFEEIIILDGIDGFRPQFFSADNNNVFAYSNIGRDKYAFVEYDLINKTEIKVIFEDKDYDVFSYEERNDNIFPCAGFAYSVKKQKELYAYYCAENYKTFYPDPEIEIIIKKAKSEIGDYNVIIKSYTDDLNKIILCLFNGKVKGEYYLYDRMNDTFKHLHTLSEWLNEDEFAEIRPVEFEARDGLTINGYIAVPKGVELKNLPVVACIHGGPTLRDTPGYNDIVQFFANRGYLVLQVNYRGSDGYGKKFVKAGFKSLGVKTHNDIIDGLNWLVEKGMADKSRIAFYGFSSGGYEAMAGVMFYPDYYACSIGISGLVNLSSTFGMMSKKFQERWGEPAKDSLLLYNSSPLFHTDKIKKPLMIINGAKDTAIPIDEVDKFVNLLKQQGNEVEYLRYENEDHNIIYNPELKIEVFQKIDSFLAKHIGTQK